MARPSVKEVQSWLYDYLSTGIDPHDFGHYIPEWMEEAGVQWRGPDDPFADDLTPGQLKRFEKWLVDARKGEDFVSKDPYGAPAYLVFSEVKKLPAGTWGVHFTRADPFEAFDRGVTLHGLALSTWKKEKDMVDCRRNLSEDIGTFEVVFGFAFEALADRGAASRLDVMSYGLSKYGDNAVLFRTDGAVRAWHTGDEEYQMIFPLCSEYDVIPMHDPDPSDIAVEDEGGKERRFGSLEALIEWAGGTRRARSPSLDGSRHPPGTLKQFGKELRRLLNSGEVFAILREGDWGAGGCWTLAEALAEYLGPPAEVMAISERRRGGVDVPVSHVLVRYVDVYIDHNGAQTERELLRNLEGEGYDRPRLEDFTLDLREMAAGEEFGVACDIRAKWDLMRHLRQRFGVPR